MAESLDDKVKKLIEAHTVTEDINTSLIKVNKTYTTAIDRVAKLTGSSEKLGAAWSIVTRATETLIPGVSKALFSLRSLTFVAKYAQLSRDEAAKSDKETLEVIRTINKERGNALDLLKQIEVGGKINSAISKQETLYQNEQIGFLIENLGFVEGIAEARRRAEEVSEKTFKIEEKMSKLDRDRLYMAHDFSKVRGMDINKVALALKHEEKLTNMQARRKALENQIQALGTPGTDTGRARLELVTSQLEALNAEIEGQEKITQAAKDRTGYSFEGGKIKRPPGPQMSAGEIVASPFKDLLKDLQSVFDHTIGKKLNGVVKFFKGPSIKMIGSYLKMGIVIFGKVLLFITLLGLIVYMMHRLGVFEKLAEFFREGKFDIVKDLFMQAVEGFMIIGTAIFDFIVAGYKVLEALFTGNGLGKALEGFMESFLMLFVKVIEGTIKILVGLLGALLATYALLALAGLEVIVENLRKKLPKWMGGEAPGTAEKFAESSANIATIPKSDSAKGSILAGGYGGGGFIGMATGGVVTSGGMFRVGEEGPEAVALPAGTRVLNNQQTRSMGNTINVHVNGRVGASDQELNELARKLGEKINKEMNRFGASGFRA